MQDKQSVIDHLKKKHKSKSRILATGTIIALIIALSPLFFYSYLIIPSEVSYKTFLGTIQSNYYQDVQVLFWVLFGKLAPFMLLVIWFFTCKHWWYHVILIPMSMYIVQIVVTLNDDLQFTDSKEIIFIIPIIALIATLSYTIRINIFDRIYGVDLSQEFKRVKWNGKIVKIPADSNLDLPEVHDNEEFKE
ncbi:hypothetical protein [Dokdonia sp. Hel_I_53]|uniref:hypothetical protein n=1 Tax=Dokdonia sp. Hel_I_53 TaxID=1566287 RepID=UPI00119A61FC|nr:hypothetical protein [Dokdonia sp. Hel_I_53]TVZ51059.1 hypothetical protein OD90_0195 [Dokdonia sp. Hel_I_53]